MPMLLLLLLRGWKARPAGRGRAIPLTASVLGLSVALLGGLPLCARSQHQEYLEFDRYYQDFEPAGSLGVRDLPAIARLIVLETIAMSEHTRRELSGGPEGVRLGGFINGLWGASDAFYQAFADAGVEDPATVETQRLRLADVEAAYGEVGTSLGTLPGRAPLAARNYERAGRLIAEARAVLGPPGAGPNPATTAPAREAQVLRQSLRRIGDALAAISQALRPAVSDSPATEPVPARPVPASDPISDPDREPRSQGPSQGEGARSPVEVEPESQGKGPDGGVAVTAAEENRFRDRILLAVDGLWAQVLGFERLLWGRVNTGRLRDAFRPIAGRAEQLEAALRENGNRLPPNVQPLWREALAALRSVGDRFGLPRSIRLNADPVSPEAAGSLALPLVDRALAELRGFRADVSPRARGTEGAEWAAWVDDSQRLFEALTVFRREIARRPAPSTSTSTADAANRAPGQPEAVRPQAPREKQDQPPSSAKAQAWDEVRRAGRLLADRISQTAAENDPSPPELDRLRYVLSLLGQIPRLLAASG
jgi:hypothetical protein